MTATTISKATYDLPPDIAAIRRSFLSRRIKLSPAITTLIAELAFEDARPGREGDYSNYALPCAAERVEGVRS